MANDRWANARLQKKKDIRYFKKLTEELGEKRVDAMINGGDTAKIWEQEKRAHMQLARLQNRKLREGFLES